MTGAGNSAQRRRSGWMAMSLAVLVGWMQAYLTALREVDGTGRSN